MEGKVKVGNREFPIRMNMGAMLRFKRLTGREVGELTNGDMEGMITLVYACTAAACNADGVEFGYTLEDFADNLEPESFSEASKILADQAEKKSK